MDRFMCFGSFDFLHRNQGTRVKVFRLQQFSERWQYMIERLQRFYNIEPIDETIVFYTLTIRLAVS